MLFILGGDSTIHPGDIIIGDADGVVAVPQAKERIIWEAAKKKLEKDEQRAKSVLGDAQSALNYINRLIPEK